MLNMEEIYLGNQEQVNTVRQFLNKFDLSYEDDIDYTLVVYEKESIIATASKAKNILKCFAILPQYQGLGITNNLVKKIEDRMFQEGLYHFFIITPSYNKLIFTSIGYQEIITSSNIMILENGNININRFLHNIKNNNYIDDKEKTCIIMNANPFSLGHLYLIEKACKENEEVLVFVVSENKSSFPFNIRYRLVKEGTKHLQNVKILETGPYLVSNLTFPTYFLKNKNDVVNIQTKMDCEIFTKYYQPIFNIKRRYIGTEPYCEVTKAYNTMMKEILPQKGVEVIEIERVKVNDEIVSASKIRHLLRSNNYELLKKLVPLTTYNYLVSQEAKDVINQLIHTQGRH
ncbi:MAG TPA: [citrate (pro-3S)-lyase] ligase [Haloplasmataceae bacterium]